MAEKVRQYVAIDAKSFYASVECVERHLNPLTTNLVVADESRTEKTICLAVSPSLKAHGIPGRVRLFEVIQRMKQVNQKRLNAGIRSGAIWRDPETRKLNESSSFLRQMNAPQAKIGTVKSYAQIQQRHL